MRCAPIAGLDKVPGDIDSGYIGAKTG